MVRTNGIAALRDQMLANHRMLVRNRRSCRVLNCLDMTARRDVEGLHFTAALRQELG